MNSEDMLKAVITLASLTTSGIGALQAAQVVSSIITLAAQEQREFTASEWSLITGADDAAKKALDTAIASHGG